MFHEKKNLPLIFPTENHKTDFFRLLFLNGTKNWCLLSLKLVPINIHAPEKKEKSSGFEVSTRGWRGQRRQVDGKCGKFIDPKLERGKKKMEMKRHEV
jgi:hypothetical protein